MQQMWAHGQAPLPPIRDLRSGLARGHRVHPVTACSRKTGTTASLAPSEVAAALAPFTEDCNLAEYRRTTRRTTTSKLDLSRSRPSRFQAASPQPLDRQKATHRGLVWGTAFLWLAASGCWRSPWPRPRPWIGPKSCRPTATPARPPAGGAPIAPPERTPIKVGVLHSRTGTMAISERPVIDATLLAIDEINEQGGCSAGPLEAVVEDGESDSATFAAKAEKLITTDKVCTVFGCWTSASRKTVLP